VDPPPPPWSTHGAPLTHIEHSDYIQLIYVEPVEHHPDSVGDALPIQQSDHFNPFLQPIAELKPQYKFQSIPKTDTPLKADAQSPLQRPYEPFYEVDAPQFLVNNNVRVKKDHSKPTSSVPSQPHGGLHSTSVSVPTSQSTTEINNIYQTLTVPELTTQTTPDYAQKVSHKNNPPQPKQPASHFPQLSQPIAIRSNVPYQDQPQYLNTHFSLEGTSFPSFASEFNTLYGNSAGAEKASTRRSDFDSSASTFSHAFLSEPLATVPSHPEVQPKAGQLTGQGIKLLQDERFLPSLWPKADLNRPTIALKGNSIDRIDEGEEVEELVPESRKGRRVEVGGFVPIRAEKARAVSRTVE
jgi:hypothetical protein